MRGALAAREGEDPVLEPPAIVTHGVAASRACACTSHARGCSLYRVAARVDESPADAVALKLPVHGEEKDLDAPA